MKGNLKRFACLLLAVSLSVTALVIPASAKIEALPGGGGGIAIATSAALKPVVKETIEILDNFKDDLIDSAQAVAELLNYWYVGFNGDLSVCVPTTTDTLNEMVAQMSDAGFPVSLAYDSTSNFYYIVCIGDYVENKYGVRIPLPGFTGRVYQTRSGQVLIAFADDAGASTGSTPISRNIWLPFSTAVSKKQVSVLTRDCLADQAFILNSTDRTCYVRDTYINDKRFYIIIDTGNNIYANADGVPYVAHYEATVTDQKYDYIVNEGDTINEGDNIYNDNSTIIEGSTTNYEIVDNSQVIDLSNGTFTYIGEANKEEFYIDELVYDFSSQSYQADTYNITYDNDTYTTNNFLFQTTYNITNVYVTNIGQSELYEPLELYYVLPDGRSSADLTAEEVAGLSFEFSDCVNYAKSATDTYLRALYHFDGNTDDSSYFSTQGKFSWLEGASISYMDVGTFGGALYLGPEEHQFQITLPTDIGSSDFSLQFRYYQAGNADTQSNIENSLLVGGVPVFSWDESTLYNSSGVALTSLSVGSWIELAVIRSNGTVYLYHNGLKVSSFTDTGISRGSIVLTLGSTSRAYSMIDELRFVNRAVVEDGASYTCTSVPYDTNSVLVLPDGSYEIADEYIEIKSSRDNLLSSYGLADWCSFNQSYLTTNSSIFSGESTKIGTALSGYKWPSSSACLIYGFPYFNANSVATSLSFSSSGSQILSNNVANLNSIYADVCLRRTGYVEGNVVSGTSYTPFNSVYDYGSLIPSVGLYSCVASYHTYGTYQMQYLPAGEYTLSIVNASGGVGSCTFTVRSASDGTDLCKTTSVSDARSHVDVDSVTMFGYTFGSMVAYDEYGDVNGPGSAYYGTQYIFISPSSDNPDPIIYVELTNASTTDLIAEKVSCIYSSEEVKPNTAAIQTDIPIKGYTVGGVRPTFSARGDVWMPVSNNRITNVYVYNGSAWVEFNARWYTGTRWIPIYGFDITTLEDCWDIADIDTTIVMIGSESQFWSWLQGAWQKMLDKLDAIIDALSDDSDSPTVEYVPILPSGYTQLEYIESSGTQYIDTGIPGNNDNLTFSFRFNLLSFSSYAGIFGNYVSEDANCWRLIQTSVDEDKFFWTSNVQGGRSSSVVFAKNVVNSVVMNLNEFIINGSSVHRTQDIKGTVNDTNIAIFANRCTSWGSRMRLYEFKIADADDLLCDFIPCINAAGEVGLYDLVSEAFFGNCGTGEFIAGAVVEMETKPVGPSDNFSDVLPDQDSTLDDPNTEDDESEDGYSFLELAGSLVDAVWNVVTGAVKTAFDGIGGVVTSVQYIGDFFQFYDDGEIYQTVKYTGEGSIWD